MSTTRAEARGEVAGRRERSRARLLMSEKSFLRNSNDRDEDVISRGVGGRWTAAAGVDDGRPTVGGRVVLDNRRRGGRRRSLRAAHLRGLAEAVPVRRGRGILSPGAGVPRAPDREAPRGVPVELPPARQRRARRTAPAALRGRTQVGVPRRPARRRDARRGSARLRAIQAPRGDRAAPRSAGPHAAGCLRAGRHAGVRRRRGELPRRRGDGVPAVRAERSGAGRLRDVPGVRRRRRGELGRGELRRGELGRGELGRASGFAVRFRSASDERTRTRTRTFVSRSRAPFETRAVR